MSKVSRRGPPRTRGFRSMVAGGLTGLVPEIASKIDLQQGH